MISRDCSNWHRRRECGYTLVELLIVILIIAIMSAVLVPTFTQRTQISDVKLGAETVRSALLTAQVIALSYTREQIAQACQTHGGGSIPAQDINYIFVSLRQTENRPASLQISAAKEKNIANSCGIESPVYLSGNLRVNDYPLILFTVGKMEINLPDPNQTEASVEIIAKSDPSKKAKIIVNKFTNQIRIE